MEYFELYKLLHTLKSGFRTNHSCQTALTALVDEWLKVIDNGNIIGVLFLDLAKAFDLLCHEMLF